MILKMHFNAVAGFLLLTAVCAGCKSKKELQHPLFDVLDENRTGLHFANKLHPTAAFNMFNYMYFYNGAGLGAGDFNNDGLIDLFFASNQGDNKLFINKGNLQFTDVTTQASIPQDHGWSTGVSVVDINNDGLLDLYVCRVGKYEILNSRNQFLICKGIDKDGIPVYEDRAAQYGLDFSGFSTQAVFFDYDMDGDLDMYLLNHAVHQNGSFAPRNNFSGTYSELSGDRIYRNNGIAGGKTDTPVPFTDVTKETGINSSSIGYGLGAVATDLNLDGFPDLYVGNDFHENDYLYINQKDGRFSDESSRHLMHTSKFSMGVDIADVTNDGLPEIISMDMLPSDPNILKRSFGDDTYDIFLDKIASGYNYQYSRNNFQYNRGNGVFSEAGLYAGLAATDWSWSPLWMDFDNDGTKDLFISNGIPKRLNDMDYINFVSNREIQEKLNDKAGDENNLALVEKFPEIKIPNKLFHNNGNLRFTDMADSIGNNHPTFSNGAVYADLDNDGDLDVVVNNIDDAAMVYKNNSNEMHKRVSVEIKLHGPATNINAIGAKLVLFSGNQLRTYENYPVRGFQSSMQIPLHIGLHQTRIDSLFLIWPDNSYQPVVIADSAKMELKYSPGLPSYNYQGITGYIKKEGRPMEDITSSVRLNYRHVENSFNEFNREPLITHMVSTEGPALAVADINKDGLDDVFIGSSKTFHDAVFFQQPGGKFIRSSQPEMQADSMYEDVDATWVNLNNDGYPDLVIASGGNEYYGNDRHLSPRAFINDGSGRLKKLDNAFDNILLTASCIVPYDFNGDGFDDLFIGGRSVPWEYGQLPRSYLLQNDGTGKFSDVTAAIARDLVKIGMVTGAAWADIDNDKDPDLVVCCEWGGIEAFINSKGVFTRNTLSNQKGWWNFVMPFDADNDGDMDLIAGNLGLNSRLKASPEEPVNLYYNDFDDNGKKEQVLTYFLQGKETPFLNKEELEKQLPFIKKDFFYARDFAKATIEEVFGKDKLKNAEVLSANYFASSVFINNGGLNFSVKPLPWQAQLAPYRDAAILDANGDNLPDVLLGGNYYDNNIQMGRYDADFGTILINRGSGNFSAENINGLTVKGQVRRIRPVQIEDRKSFILARNNDSASVISFRRR